MAVSILSYSVSIPYVLESSTTSLTKTKAHPLTKPFSAGFEAFQTKLLAVHTQEVHLGIAIYEGSARVSVVNDDINDLIDVVSSIALAATKGDRTALLYTLYFGNKRPSDVKRPVLSPKKLERIRGWIALLKASPIVALSALSSDVEEKVKEADKAIAALAEAKLKNKEFRSVGARKALIDEFNALRKTVHGSISELPHKHPELNLPGSFADRFFRHEAQRKNDMKGASSEDLAELVAAQEAKLGELKRALNDKLAEEAAAAKANAEAEAQAAELALAEKAAKEALAKVTALKAKLA